ncbi:MAG: FAD-dependent oxidoreductase [Paracoccaceae bacterium]|nr:MAG: FAD-dependent oxidoreductase [Paracoccaceae bacterium]
MAGLGAASRLAKGGARVTVIEARGRTGGRTHTSHLWPDLPVDMGASWIHGTKGNPVTKLARKVGLRITPTTYARSVTYDHLGQPVDFIKPAKRAMKLLELARAAVDGLEADVSLEAAITAHPDWQALGPHDRAEARLAINTRIEHEYSGDWSRMSAWHFDDGTDFPGDEAVVTPGFGPIIAHLARGLDIRLGEPVTAIAPTARGVAVTTASGRHEADCAIVTLPLGVLQSGRVAFAEPLDPRRQRAIDSLGMGLLNKCVLRFDRVFWPEDADWIDYLSPAETLWADWTSYLRATGHPLLAGFNAARTADEIEALDDRATTALAMEALRSMFGSAVPDPIGAQVSRWRQDPFALGAYSFKAVGTRRKDRKALFGSDWDGRLHFAGEACSPDQPATVHGALITGRQTAARLAAGGRREG